MTFLQELLLSSEDLTSFLDAFAVALAGSLSRCEARSWCAITLLRQHRPRTVAWSHPHAMHVDQIQLDHGSGPCLVAVTEHRRVLVEDTRSDSRWPEYSDAVAAEGVLSVLALPFELDDEARAVLNIYADRPCAFGPATVAGLEERVASVSVVMRLAVRMARHRDTETDLKAAMTSRTTIDLALGIIMGQKHCTQEVAFGILRKASNDRNVKLKDLAAALVATVGKGPASTHFTA